MHRLWSILLILLLSLSLGLSHANSPAATIEPTALPQKRQELQRAKRQLLESQRDIQHNIGQEKSILSRLDNLDRSRARLQQDARQTAQDLQETQAQVEALRQTYDQWSYRDQQQRRLLSHRLRQLYKLGQYPYAKLLLSARDVMEFSRKVQYIRHLARRDQQQLQHYHKGQAQVARAQANLTEAEARLQVQQDTLRLQQVELDRERQQKNALLQQIRKEKQLAEQTVTEYTETVRALTDMIQQLNMAQKRKAEHRDAARRAVRREATEPSSTPTAVKGRLLWPVRGPVLSGFGRVRHPNLDVYTVHKGMYIGAALGSTVKAVAAGSVVYADWFKGLGKLLIIDHGNHLLTLYGHTSDLSVKVGDQVDAHQIIAKVGDSSTMDEPALYFAIRYNTAPQDPTQWLRQQSASLTQEP